MMNYVLAEISRHNLRLYHNKYGDNRTFVPQHGTNEPVPLAICSVKNELRIGNAAIRCKNENVEKVFDDLFETAKTDQSLLDIKSRDFIKIVLKELIDKLCQSIFYSDISDNAKQITLILLFANDVLENEMKLVANGMREIGFYKVIPIPQSKLSIKFFLNCQNYDWSQERNGMVVMSDNKDLSIKCFSLDNGELLYQDIFKGYGCDPRFNWAVDEIWKTDVSRYSTCFKKEEAVPLIENALSIFLAGNSYELNTTIKLPNDTPCNIFMARTTYNNYSHPGIELSSIIDSVVKKAGLDYETTGIVLQGYASNNKFFHDSFGKFDPISDEDYECSCQIRNQLLCNLIDGIDYEFKGREKLSDDSQSDVPVREAGEETPDDSTNVDAELKCPEPTPITVDIDASIRQEGKWRDKKHILTVVVTPRCNRLFEFDATLVISTDIPDRSEINRYTCYDIKKGDGQIEFETQIPLQNTEPGNTIMFYVFPRDRKISQKMIEVINPKNKIKSI